MYLQYFGQTAVSKVNNECPGFVVSFSLITASCFVLLHTIPSGHVFYTLKIQAICCESHLSWHACSRQVWELRALCSTWELPPYMSFRKQGESMFSALVSASILIRTRTVRWRWSRTGEVDWVWQKCILISPVIFQSQENLRNRGEWGRTVKERVILKWLECDAGFF